MVHSETTVQLNFDENYTINLSGAYTFSSIEDALKIWNQTKLSLKGLPKVILCCTAVEDIDSSFIAFLLEIKRYCSQEEICLEISDLSLSQRDFFKAYGILEIFQP